MATQINEERLTFSFELIWLANVDYNIFLSSAQPDEIVFAVLGNFGIDNSQTAATRIIERLSQTSAAKPELERYLQQLRILANLRKLKPLIEQLMESITKYIKPEDDFLYKKGVEHEKHSVVIRLLNKETFTDEQIAQIAAVPPAMVAQTRKEISGESK